MAEYDPIDPRARELDDKAAQARERQDATRADNDLRWLMNSRQGRRMAWRLLEHARVHKPTFSTNALQMAFNEGFRSYGTWMLARILEVCPERYLDLLKEQEDERNTSGDGPNSK